MAPAALLLQAIDDIGQGKVDQVGGQPDMVLHPGVALAKQAVDDLLVAQHRHGRAQALRRGLPRQGGTPSEEAGYLLQKVFTKQ